MVHNSNGCLSIFGHCLSYFQDSCPSIKNVLLLDSEGKRVAVKYYTDDWPTHAAKLAFEKSVFTKTLKTNARTEGILYYQYNFIIDALNS